MIGCERVQAVGQGGRPRLQDHRRLDFVQRAVSDGRYSREPGSGRDLPGTNFLPHHEPMMMSGRRAMTSSADTIRSFADSCGALGPENVGAAGNLDQFRDPAMPEIIGSSHSSK